eukprot:Mycagemm_TRINITY_DN10366_c2_g10::TRINITY_DN10366_c2_g10_i1::g.915::m.915 type:complete len:116 gc:universal TRINITY_DN10366_c2_g10_i1:700-353(-)
MHSLLLRALVCYTSHRCPILLELGSTALCLVSYPLVTLRIRGHLWLRQVRKLIGTRTCKFDSWCAYQQRFQSRRPLRIALLLYFTQTFRSAVILAGTLLRTGSQTWDLPSFFAFC